MQNHNNLRKYIRCVLRESYQGFLDRVGHIEYNPLPPLEDPHDPYSSPYTPEEDELFNDPTFQGQDKKTQDAKNYAIEIKRAWRAEADHDFLNNDLTKIHWISSNRNPQSAFNRMVNASGRDEISVSLYDPTSEFTTYSSEHGDIGIIIKGYVTLASTGMDALMTGYSSSITDTSRQKFKNSGVPRRPTRAALKYLETYILDKSSYHDFIEDNEAIVDNWKAVGIVFSENIGLEDFVESVPDWAYAGMGLNKHEIEMITAAVNTNLPLYGAEMKPIDRNKVQDFLNGMIDK